MPLITVLLPVKDNTATLPRALSSTLRALPGDSEVAVLDDGSVEDVASIVARVDDPRVRLLRNTASAGVGVALQQLLCATDSRYVARMDADDITLPGRFRHQLGALAAGADLVFSPVVNFWDGSRRIRPGLPLPISAPAMPAHLLVHNPLCHPTLAARRDAVATAGGYRDIRAEDHDLWLRALAAGLRLVRTPLPVLGYRHHAGQLSGSEDHARAAFADARLRDSYRAFVDRCFGVPATWLDALWSGESGTPKISQELAPLRELLETRAAMLSAPQRLVLTRTTRLLDVRTRDGAHPR